MLFYFTISVRTWVQRGGVSLHKAIFSDAAFLTDSVREHSLSIMEVQFTPEQEAQLSQVAKHKGTPAEQLVKQAALRLVEEDAEIRAGVRLGVEQPTVGNSLTMRT
jgi:hypothetical protein